MIKSLFPLAITVAFATLANQAIAASSDQENSGSWIIRGGIAEVIPVPQEVKVKPLTDDAAGPGTKYKRNKAFTGSLSLTYLLTPNFGLQISGTLPTSIDQKEERVWSIYRCCKLYKVSANSINGSVLLFA